MGQFFLIVVVALTVAAVVFGVTVLVSGSDTGLTPAEPDGRAVPLPASRPLQEDDLGVVRFDTAVRGYRMGQVDQALRRAAYDIGYKDELIGVLEAEVTALREGRALDADALRRAREAAQAPTAVATLPPPEASEPAVIAAEPAPVPVAPASAAPVPAAPEIVTPVFADPIVEQAGPAPAAPAPEPAAPAPDTPPIKDNPADQGDVVVETRSNHDDKSLIAGEGAGDGAEEGNGEAGATAAVEAVDEKGDSSRA